MSALFSAKVPVKQVRLIVQVAQRLGIEPQVLLQACHIEPSLLESSEHLLPAKSCYELLKQLAHLSGNPDVGLYTGRASYLNLVDILLYLSSVCVSLRQWLNMMPSVLEIYGDLGKAVIIKQGNELRSEWRPAVGLAISDRFVIDMALSIAAHILHSICLQPVVITKAQFTYPRPNDTRILQQIFGNNLQFEQPYSALFFDLECLDYPLIQANQLDTEQASPWQRYINSVAGDSFLDELRQHIACQLPSGEMTIDVIAQELGISRRTLQRHLKQRETNFQEVVQELRSQVALHFLNDNKMDITSMAFVLGYSDSSAFSAAFKNWHGCAPSRFHAPN